MYINLLLPVRAALGLHAGADPVRPAARQRALLPLSAHTPGNHHHYCTKLSSENVIYNVEKKEVNVYS